LKRVQSLSNNRRASVLQPRNGRYRWWSTFVRFTCQWKFVSSQRNHLMFIWWSLFSTERSSNRLLLVPEPIIKDVQR
jgi:hypothetical protein